MDEAVFGRYRLLSVIGEGGMGRVYRAHDTVIGRDVAVKVLSPELSAEPGYQERFRREAHTAARLTEPHIIPIHDTGEIDGRLFLVMPVIDGIDVHGLLAREGPMSPPRAVSVIAQVAAALNAAHAVGLVHRDVKPANVLVTGDDFVYLIDFGIAHDAGATKLTQTGTIVGTYTYMAPERFSAGVADARGDVYALACVLYECLTGVQPYPGDSLEQQITAHLTMDPPRPSRRNPGVPEGFDEVIATGMAKNPDQRYQSAKELAGAAQAVLAASPAAWVGPSVPVSGPSGGVATVAASASGRGGKSVKTRQVIQRDKLGPRTKIGQGGQGVVYRAPNVKTKFAASMVYKEYKPAARSEIDFTALAAMPALVEDSLSYSQAERLISMAAWPCAIIEDGGAPTGFVMPAIPDAFFVELTTVKGAAPTIAEFQHLLNHSSVLAARGIALDDVQRYTLLRETASALAFLHKHRVCVGDISPKNLLFSLNPHEAVYFIDCDAMRINSVSALPQVETPGWNAPAGEELATIYTDTYKLGLLALRLLSGEQDTTNPAHLPSSTPGMLRQVITDTLANPPQQRPLPEAWTYVLGHAIEHAQNRTQSAPPTAAPVSTPPPPPQIPTVRSRPVGQSRPPIRPSVPPVSVPPISAPPPAYAPPRAFPRPASPPTSSKIPLLFGGGLAAVVLVVLVVVAVAIANSNDNPPATTPQSLPTTEASAYPTRSYPTYAPPSTVDTPTVSVPPPLVQTPDSYGVNCSAGYPLPGRSGWATHSGRGSDKTSCQFAQNVLIAYWNSYPSPSRDSRQVIVAGTVPCPSVRANAQIPVTCNGDNFVMDCAVLGSDPWITCTGGNEAKVYIY